MSGELVGTWRLVGHNLRQDRVRAAVWAIFVPALVLGTAKQYEQAFPTPQARAEFAAEAKGNSALTARSRANCTGTAWATSPCGRSATSP
ncbi:hypothetical protein [Kibdelosporangium aridum]|uniref:hypothetical protein n=1 Tax=Kibdelosporangium aridum TaxID=2030 RepID=UPI001179F903|nr:hypothetical protein [Kibdelosporangium aridum]